MFKSKNGITLILLIITIIVLLVLAGVTINMILGENGLFNKAKTSVGKYENAQLDEQAVLDLINQQIKSNRDDSEEVALLKQRIEDLEKEIKGVNPVGTIIAYYGATAPTGYLPCDGTEKNTSEYPELAAFLGANGNTFNLPDLRGEFLRGAGNNSHTQTIAGVTVYEGNGATVRTHQKSTVFRNIWHGYGTDAGGTGVTINFYSNSSSGTTSNLDFDDTADRWMVNSTHGTYLPNGYTKNSPNTTNHVAFSSRPTNTSVLYCIKY